MALPAVFVTGGNAGIGAAICKQLVLDKGCRVFLGTRTVDKGKAAVLDMQLGDKASHISVVQCDVQSEESIKQAASVVKEGLGGQSLLGVVNNAGTGFAHNSTDEVTIDTNLRGPKRVFDNFLPLLDATGGGRVVNLGSGAGPGFVNRITDVAVKRQMCNSSTKWDALEALMARFLGGDTFGGGNSYGLSKAALSVYTMQLAAQHPAIGFSCVSPGFIATAMTEGMGASKPADEGTVSVMRCLFEPLAGSGFYIGSDGLRSPLHFMRDPGSPEYDGTPPVFE